MKTSLFEMTNELIYRWKHKLIFFLVKKAFKNAFILLVYNKL